MRKIFLLAIFIAHCSFFLSPLNAQVASSDEMLVPEKVGRETMLPVSASDIADGEYEVESESSSSMFRITKSRLSVKEGQMSVKITMSGKSYTKFFLGSAQDASDSKGKGEILAQSDENGAIFFSFPISELNSSIKCAAFSSKKGKWYEREILFDASSLPEKSLFVSPERNPAPLKDGSYLVKVALSGGSGKAKITSPAKVTVKDGKAVAIIEWSSSNYDYMKVNGERFDVDKKILDKGGNSTFTIPIYAFDRELPLYADTLAMSKSHEILYYLNFDSKSAKKKFFGW